MIRHEPYRLLFPLGLFCALIGLGVWIPSYFWPQLFPYPGQGHAIIQIQGFLFSFILGFLCTMLPKVLGVPPLGALTLALFIIGLAVTTVAALFGEYGLSQMFHLFLLLNFGTFILIRFPKRRNNPPAFFVFIALAMLADLKGTTLRLLILAGWWDVIPSRTEILLQYQAFPLLLIMGVGGFLLPKLFGNAVIDPKSLSSQSNSSIRFLLLLGLTFLLSYGVQYWGVHALSTRIGYGIRAVVWLWFLSCSLRVQHVPSKFPAYLTGGRVAPYFIAMGLVLPVFFPTYTLAWEHLIFITGFLWLTLSIATRVVTAHGGRLDLLDRNRRQTLAYGILIVLATAARVSTDIWPGAHALHLALASTFVISALVIWTRIHIPLIFVTPSDKAL